MQAPQGIQEVRRTRTRKRTSHASVIKDVALRAGVSTATVSRVLNTPEVVAPSTAERVREAMDHLDYRPNLLAKGLITRTSGVLGVVLPDFHGDFYGALLQAADAEARRSGYHLVVASDARAGSADAAQSLPVHFLDGLIASIPFPDSGLLRSIVDLDIAAVLIDAAEDVEGVDHFKIDNAVGAAAAVEHLLESTAPADCFHVGGVESNYDTAERARAFCATLERHGFQGASKHVQFGGFTTDWGVEWAGSMLPGRTEKPTAVFAGNDDIAFGVLTAAISLGIRVPDQLRIVGFDDSRLSSVMRPTLTSVRVPLEAIATEAIRTCVARIKDPSLSPTRSTMSTELVVRESSVPVNI